MTTISKSALCKLIPMLLLAVGLGSCISDDDIPYPRVRANIVAMEVEGQTRPAAIDSMNRTVNIVLNDSVDIRSLRLKKFAVTPGATVADSTALLGRPLDLSDTLRLTLHIYQDWVWSITATQNIERFFTVEGQIGESVIDEINHTVSVDIPTGHSLTDVRVTSMKLGVAGSTVTPNLLDGPVDFSKPVTVTVDEYGRLTDWTITVNTTDLAVDLTGVDAWTCVAWAHASVQAGRSIGFEYRRAGTMSWDVVPAGWIFPDGPGTYTARLIHLDQETQYEVRAISGDDASPAVGFTTQNAIQPPNMTFDNWWLDGKIWCPWSESGAPYWGTGNKGATTLGDSNTTPIANIDSPTGYSGASLETRFVGIGPLGKIAAGNLFAGTYVRTEGTNGVLAFGRPYDRRPTALRATIKYTGTVISHSSSEMSQLKGRPDTCIVWLALTDADEPFEIRTKPSDRHLFDRNADDVVAYGSVQYSGTMDDYITVDIPLEYKSTSRTPSYILMVASASKYGDYFTGGNGSLLLIKKFELLYDFAD